MTLLFIQLDFKLYVSFTLNVIFISDHNWIDTTVVSFYTLFHCIRKTRRDSVVAFGFLEWRQTFRYGKHNCEEYVLIETHTDSLWDIPKKANSFCLANLYDPIWVWKREKCVYVPFPQYKITHVSIFRNLNEGMSFRQTRKSFVSLRNTPVCVSQLKLNGSNNNLLPTTVDFWLLSETPDNWWSMTLNFKVCSFKKFDESFSQYFLHFSVGHCCSCYPPSWGPSWIQDPFDDQSSL